MENKFFNAHHSPIGAFASFTLGFKGAKGGPAISLGKPADSNVYIGLQDVGKSSYKALPFFDCGIDESGRYSLEKQEPVKSRLISPFADNEIQRDFEICTDRWIAGDLDVTIYSPVQSIPDPQSASEDQLKSVLLPAVMVEITVDNTGNSCKRRAFIGYDGSDRYHAMRHVHDEKNRITGIAQGGMTAIIGHMGSVRSAIDFSIESILTDPVVENWDCGLGSTALLVMEIPAGEITTFRFAVCFYIDGCATTGISTHYYYTRLFKNLEEVGRFALENFNEIKNRCILTNRNFKNNCLSEDQRFMMAYAIRSYYGSTELLEAGEKPVWVVNEGEYRMMNTLDLTVDQLFYEMNMNPWTVRNVLDLYLERYSYRDTVRFPGDKREFPGGLTFTHDMGVANVFSHYGYSSYEKGGLDGCFSYMSHEQLVNWLCCAVVYINNSGDEDWLKKHTGTLIECFNSMLNRDNPDPGERNGVMGLDSSRTMGGAEITTYDSLDVSLAQSRNNVYLAGKCWAVYVALEKIFKRQDLIELSGEAGKQAERCAYTITRHLSAEGYIPAVLGENNISKIVPAIEGLVFPYFAGCKEALDANGRFGGYIRALKSHFEKILVKGICLFDDNGWKLSSTSNNSWLSKIYLCQFIARRILDIKTDACGKLADTAHVNWLTRPENSYWSWSDQIVSGFAEGSKYYPRGVTSFLWLEE